MEGGRRKEHQSTELPSANGKWGRWFVIRGATCNFYPSPSCLPSPFHDLKRVFASLRPARITTCIALATNIPPLHPPLTIFKTVAGNCSLLKVPQPLLSPSFNAVCRGCGRIRWKDSFHFLSNWLERYQEDRHDFRLIRIIKIRKVIIMNKLLLVIVPRKCTHRFYQFLSWSRSELNRIIWKDGKITTLLSTLSYLMNINSTKRLGE